MKIKNGYFIISLDLEMHWGIFDAINFNDYEENLRNVSKVVKRLLELADKYSVKLSFACVGMLLNENKTELINSLPKIKPFYNNQKLNSYDLIPKIGLNEKEDPYHFGGTVIQEIRRRRGHEIASHTYSHYYCKELGQTEETFEADILAFNNLAKEKGITLKSIVFPKNQINTKYVDICYKYGFQSYRGTEKNFIYTSRKEGQTPKLFRLLRLMDTYFNITGYHIYEPRLLKSEKLINLPSSRFLRPYNPKLFFLENMKLKRIKRAMTKASKSNKVYHLWWHPHNCGTNMESNFNNIEKVFKHYAKLNSDNGFESVTMEEMSDLIMKA